MAVMMTPARKILKSVGLSSPTYSNAGVMNAGTLGENGANEPKLQASPSDGTRLDGVNLGENGANEPNPQAGSGDGTRLDGLELRENGANEPNARARCRTSACKSTPDAWVKGV
jgi:hypothetical protein